MKSTVILFALSLLFCTPGFTQDKELDRLDDVYQVLKDLQELPNDSEEGIPYALLEKAEAVVIIPKLKKGGLVVGGKFGRGIAMVKSKEGQWSDPTFLKITGGSLGFQVGYTSSDLFLIFKHAKTLRRLTTGKGKFTLGGDVAVAAGPHGRTASANTDLDFQAEIYSYSKSRGIFAGVSLDGSELKIDDKANYSFYGDKELGRNIIRSAASGLKSSEIISKIKKVLDSFKD